MLHVLFTICKAIPVMSLSFICKPCLIHIESFVIVNALIKVPNVAYFTSSSIAYIGYGIDLKNTSYIFKYFLALVASNEESIPSEVVL